MHDSSSNQGVSVDSVSAVREDMGNGEGGKKEKKGHGGARPGAGRPRSKTSGVPHTRRPEMGGEVPASLTLRIDDITDWGGNLRDLVTMEVILRCFEAAKDRFGMRICHYSVQSNHIHLLVEADDRECLIRGMRGLTTRLARNLNKHWGRKGKLFTDRYHSKPIEDAEHGANTIAYLGRNDLKHNCAYTITPFDPCSSAVAHRRWAEGDLRQYELDPCFAFALDPPVVRPRTPMLTDPWFFGVKHISPSIQSVPPGGDPTQTRRLVRRALTPSSGLRLSEPTSRTSTRRLATAAPTPPPKECRNQVTPHAPTSHAPTPYALPPSPVPRRSPSPSAAHLTSSAGERPKATVSGGAWARARSFAVSPSPSVRISSADAAEPERQDLHCQSPANAHSPPPTPPQNHSRPAKAGPPSIEPRPPPGGGVTS